jgi:hypothetical protein
VVRAGNALPLELPNGALLGQISRAQAVAEDLNRIALRCPGELSRSLSAATS